MLRLLYAIFFLSLTVFISAQNTLDSVKVSATRLPVKLYESGKNITVISQQDIRQLPVNTVDELLQYVGGININSRGAFGVQADIGMRGSTYSQVLVLVDNQRINDPLTGHYNNNIPVPMSEIHHIEIVRGSAAASFGADAVGGIIHVKTKAYESLNSDRVFTATQGNIGFGENKLTTTDLQVQEQRARFGFTASMKSAVSDGEQFVNPNFIQAGTGDSLYNTNFDIKTYTAALTYKTGRWKAYARGGIDARDFNAKYFYSALNSDESVEETGAYWTQGAFIHENDASRTEFTASFKKSTDEFVFNPLFPANNHTMQRMNASLFQQREWRGVSLNYGLQTDWQDIESNDRGNHTRLSNAAFILGHKTIDQLSLNGGLRLESSEQIGIQLIPQLNVAYRTNQTVVRSSIGRAIRQGDFTEQFNNNNDPSIRPLTRVGNPDLAAETSWNFDLGVDQRWKNLKFSNTIFVRNSSNLIDYVLTDSADIFNLDNVRDSASYFYAQNLKETFTLGNEFSIQYDKQFTFSKILARVNYTYLRTNSPDSIVSTYISNHPIHNINAMINYTYRGFGLNVGGNLITRNDDEIPVVEGEIPSNYAVFNTRLSYTAERLPISVYLDVRNILDTEYQEILGARMPGRWILGGIRWQISSYKLSPFVQ